MNVFGLLASDLAAIIATDGQDVTYQRDGVSLTLRILPITTDFIDENGEGDVLVFLVKDDDLGALAPPKYRDQVIFPEGDTWEVVRESFLRPSFWRVECMRRFTPRPNVPNRT